MATQDLRSMSAHPPVIAMSGLTSESSRWRAAEAGFEGHIKKPYDETGVVAAVFAALAHRQRRGMPALEPKTRPQL
jgi:DNA-binding response OmpR family regulator